MVTFLIIAGVAVVAFFLYMHFQRVKDDKQREKEHQKWEQYMKNERERNSQFTKSTILETKDLGSKSSKPAGYHSSKPSSSSKSSGGGNGSSYNQPLWVSSCGSSPSHSNSDSPSHSSGSSHSSCSSSSGDSGSSSSCSSGSSCGSSCGGGGGCSS
jgi:hypothetical protein